MSTPDFPESPLPDVHRRPFLTMHHEHGQIDPEYIDEINPLSHWLHSLEITMRDDEPTHRVQKAVDTVEQLQAQMLTPIDFYLDRAIKFANYRSTDEVDIRQSELPASQVAATRRDFSAKCSRVALRAFNQLAGRAKSLDIHNDAQRAELHAVLEQMRRFVADGVPSGLKSALPTVSADGEVQYIESLAERKAKQNGETDYYNPNALDNRIFKRVA